METKRRFFQANGVFVCALLLFVFGCGPEPSKDGLTVTGYPTGSEVEEKPLLILEFDTSMVPESQIGKEADLPVTISPKLLGIFVWKNQKTVKFRSAQRTAPSTQYTVTLKKGVTAMDGSKLHEDYSYNFSSTRIFANVSVIGLKQHAVAKQVMGLDFPVRVKFATVKKHCRYTSKKKTHKVKYAEETDPGPAKSYRVAPVGDLTLDTDWNFVCDAGIKGIEGNLGTVEKSEVAFHTYGKLAFRKMYPHGTDIVPEEDLSLALEFSNPLAQPYRINIEPKVPGFPQRCHAQGTSRPGLSCGALLEARTDYTITVGGNQKDMFGQKLGKQKKIHFRTSDAKPAISMDGGYFVAELKRPLLPVFTRNVKKITVSAVRFTPATFHKLRPSLNWWDRNPADLSESGLGQKKRTLRIEAKENKWHQEAVNPAEIFSKEPGPGMYYIEIGSKEVEKGKFSNDGREKVLANFTDIGLVSKISPVRGMVWVTRLSTGEPLPGAKLHVRNAEGNVTWRGTSDAKGLAFLPSTKELHGTVKDSTPEEENNSSYSSSYSYPSRRYGKDLDVFAEVGDDWTMVNAARSGGLAVSNFHLNRDYSDGKVQLRGFMHTDRGLYRPGDTVHVKGLVRETSLGSTLRVPKQKKAQITITDSRGTEIEEREVKISPFGGFWFDLTLTDDARLGDYKVYAKLENGSFRKAFQVEEYKPATFEVKAKAIHNRIVRNGKLGATVSADYFYGAPVTEGNVEMTVYSRPRTVRFSSFNDFNFSDWRIWDDYHSSNNSERLIAQENVAMDERGNAKLSLPVSHEDIYTDADLLVRASVAGPSNEVNRKTLVVPYYRSRRYFGIKSDNYFIETGERLHFQVVGVTPSGKVAEVPATVTISRRDWNCVWEDWGYRGSYRCNRADEVVFKETVQFTDRPIPLSFVPQKGGEYIISVDGNKMHFSKASKEIYAWGGGGSFRSDDSMTFDMVADKKEYRVGDTAKLVLKTELGDATGLLTIERDGVIETRLVKITGDTKHIEVPILDNYAPNMYVSVALVQGRTGPGKRGKPRMRMGLTNLAVRPDGNTLKVAVSTDATDYLPGKPVTATVRVTDKNDNPVMAEVALTAADEGVLSLINFSTPNPIPTFYAPFGISVDTASQYAYVRTIPGPNLERPATGGDAGLGTPRSRFMSTAIWQPAVITNAAGEATVTFDAPDNLTAYRVMAVVADKGYRFGSGDKRVTVSKPLQLHQSLPRFLTMGDTLRGGVVVHNESQKDGAVTVTLKTNNKLKVEGESSKTVTVKKGGRVPVLFSLKPAAMGEAKLTFSATMNDQYDGVVLKLPVHHPSPKRTHFVQHGATQKEVAIPVSNPDTAIPSLSKVSISMDPFGLAGIENSLRDLIGYPYGCLEQTTSKVIPMIAVKNLVNALKLEGLSKTEIDQYVAAGVAKIGRHQTSNGGFSLWTGGEAEAYYTAYALWGLHHARDAGYKVEDARIKDALSYLRNQGKTADSSEPWYDESGHGANQAFALYVRAVFGDKDAAGVSRLLETVEKQPIYGKAFLVKALAATLGADDPATQSLAATLETQAKAAVDAGNLVREPGGKKLSYYMSSDMRTTALILDALVTAKRKSPVVPKLALVLMKKRRGKAYIDTQSNIYSLLALTAYADSRQNDTPTVEVLLNEQSLFNGTLSGDNRLSVVTVPSPSGEGTVTIRPTGEVHYSVEILYRDKVAHIKPQANGLSLTRVYNDVNDQPKTVFKVGDVVRVVLTLPLTSSVSHLMVSDRLPAGLEVLNTALANVGDTEISESQRYDVFREIRDERVDFSSEYMWRQTLKYEYSARAIAAGKFVLPPAVGELMYEPDVNTNTELKYIEIKGK